VAILRIPITIRVPLSDGLVQAVATARFERLKRSGTLIRLVEGVLAKTILQAYRDLVLKTLPTLLTPEIKDFKVSKLALDKDTRAGYLELLKDRDAALLGDNEKSVQALDARIRKAQQRIGRQLTRKGFKQLSTGLYKERLFVVLNSLTDPQNLNVYFDKDDLRWAVGNVGVLKGVMVPSWVTERGNGKTYGRALMWKQLVYGAGVLSTDPSRTGKAWRFGPKRGSGGFTVKRIQGVNMKVAYDAKALGYKKQITKVILEAIIGGS